MTIVFVAVLWSTPSIDPDLTAKPYPTAILRLGIKSWTPEEYDASLDTITQNFKLARTKKPEWKALEWLAENRMKAYPSRLSMREKKRLYQLEVKWIEAEKDRRDRMASLRVLKAMQVGSD